MPVCGLPQNKSPTPVRNREAPGRSVMFTYENATEYKALLTKSYLLCLIVYLLHLIQMKTMLMHGSIGINIRAVIALICLIINLKLYKYA